MKKIIILVLIICAATLVNGQGFPGTDSLRTYNSKYITTNPATAFTNNRLHTLIRGIIDWIDTARAGTGGGGAVGVDTLWTINDSTIRYRRNGSFYNHILRGVYDTRRKVDTAYALNDSTLQIKINGTNRNIIIPGRHWDLQGILNNGSTLTENENIILADSLQFTSGAVVIETLRIRGITNSIDTTTYKPVAVGPNGATVKLDGWPASGSSPLNNVGSGYRWVTTPNGSVKSAAVDSTLTIDSTSNANSLTHKLNSNLVTSANYLNKGVPLNNNSLVGGHSISRGYGSTGDVKPWPQYTKDRLNIDTILNLSIDGAGARRIYRTFAENLTYTTPPSTAMSAGFNNIRGTTDTAHVFELVRASHRAMAALLFSKTDEMQFYSMTNSGTNPNASASLACGSCSATSEDSLREYGSRTYWVRNNDDNNTGSNWWKKPSITANETVTINKVGGRSIGIGTWAATSQWSRIEVRVDGVLKTTYDPNGRVGTYWADGFITNGITNDAIIITGLRDTLHVVELKFLDGGTMGGFDWIAPMKDPVACLASPFYIWDNPHMNSTGYTFPGGEVTEAQLDSCSNTVWSDLKYYFPHYPLYRVLTNTYYNPNDPTQIDDDGIHMKGIGQENTSYALFDVMGPKWLMTAGGGSAGTLDEVLTAGNSSDQRLLLTGNNTTNTNMEVADLVFQSYANSNSWVGSNIYFDGTNFRYKHNGPAAMLYFNSGYTEYKIAASGTAGNVATLVTVSTLAPDGSVFMAGNITNSINGAGAKLLINGTSGNLTIPNVMAIGPTSYSLGLPLMDWAITGQPGRTWYHSMGGTNEKVWDITTSTTTWEQRMGNDAYNLTTSWLKATRTGYTSALVELPAGNVRIAALDTDGSAPSTSGTTKMVITDGNGQLSFADISSATTLYSGDGTLAGDRTVTGGNNSLTFDDIFAFRIRSDYNVFTKANGTGIYSSGVIGSGNIFQIGYTPTEGVFSKGAGLYIDTNNNVGVGTQPPTTIPLYASGASTFVQGFQSNQGNFYRVDNFTANFTAGLTYYFVRIDATSGNVTMTLPAASTAFGNNMGITYVVQRIDNTGNTVTVQRAGSDTINGATSFTLGTQWETKNLTCTSTSTWAQH